MQALTGSAAPPPPSPVARAALLRRSAAGPLSPHDDPLGERGPAEERSETAAHATGHGAGARRTERLMAEALAWGGEQHPRPLTRELLDPRPTL